MGLVCLIYYSYEVSVHVRLDLPQTDTVILNLQQNQKLFLSNLLQNYSKHQESLGICFHQRVDLHSAEDLPM